MTKNRKKDFVDYDIRVLRSRHKAIRKLKRFHKPSLHGFRIWPSNWLLIDYFKHYRYAKSSKIIDIGCGWGLAGIYCAKNHDSLVTCMDSDEAVFPYLHLHAAINNIEITTLKSSFEELSVKEMRNYEVIIGSDICFWDELIEVLKSLIFRAVESGIKIVAISDPGRSSFESLGRYFINKGKGQVVNWEIDHPLHFQGRILVIK